MVLSLLFFIDQALALITLSPAPRHGPGLVLFLLCLSLVLWFVGFVTSVRSVSRHSWFGADVQLLQHVVEKTISALLCYPCSFVKGQLTVVI